MKIASALVACSILAAALGASAAEARPFHKHCSWVWRHHHKVRVCR